MSNRRWSASTRWCTSSASLARLPTRRRWGDAARPPPPPLRPRRHHRPRLATNCALSPCPTPMTMTPGNDGTDRPKPARRVLPTPAPPTANLAHGLGRARCVARAAAHHTSTTGPADPSFRSRA